MSSRVIVSAMLTLFFCEPSLASEVRVLGLGGSAGLEDEAFQFAYPSLVSNAAFVTAQLGDPTQGEAMLTASAKTGFGHFGLGLNRHSSLFTHLNTTSRSTDALDFAAGYNSRFAFDSKLFGVLGIEPEKPIDLIYGMDLGGGSGFGVRVTSAHLVRTLNGPFHESKISNQLDVHLGYHAGLGTSRLDTALKLGLIGKAEVKNDSSSGTPRDISIDRKIAPRLLVRYVNLSNDPIRPFAKLGAEYRTPEIKRLTGTFEESGKGKELSVDLQVGVNHSPSERVTLTGSVAGVYTSSQGPYVLKSPTTPANTSLETALRRGTEVVSVEFGKTTKRTQYGIISSAGAETALSATFKLLTAFEYTMFGMVKTEYPFESGKPVFRSSSESTSNSDMWRLGLSYQENSIRVDAAIALEDLIHNGPQFITGKTTEGFVGQIAATYKF